MGYTTILLDADGTLLDFEAAQREAFFAAMRRMKVPAGEEMLARYDRINHTQWKRLERGEVTREAMLAERYALLFAEWGLERDPQAANPRLWGCSCGIGSASSRREGVAGGAVPRGLSCDYYQWSPAQPAPALCPFRDRPLCPAGADFGRGGMRKARPALLPGGAGAVRRARPP